MPRSILTLFSLCLPLCLGGCFTASTAPQPDTAPLRTGAEIAQNVGETTRATQENTPNLVLYATSIDEEKTAASSKPQSPKPEKAQGTVSISASPSPATIIVDAREYETSTPSEIAVEEGRHEIKLRFPDGSFSEVKTIDVSAEATIKLHFAQPAPGKTTEPSTSTEKPEATP